MDGVRIFRGEQPGPALEPAPAIAALRHAASDPDRLAFVDAGTGEGLTRGELAERSARLAAGLARRGIGRDDVVALAMPNSAWWAVVALAVWRSGAALALLNPTWTAGEMARVLALVNPGLGIGSGPAAAVLGEGLAEAGISAEVAAPGATGAAAPIEKLLDEVTDPFEEPHLAPGALAAILFSSGTSGLPKGVRLTNANLAVAAAHVVIVFSCAARFDADSVMLAGAPYCNVMGLGLGLCAPLSVGARIVTLPIPRTEPVLRALDEHRVTHAIVAPPVVAEIASAKDPLPYELHRLQFLASGGAHVPVGDQIRAGEQLGCLVRQGYGMTEANTIAAPWGRPSDPHTVGWLGSGTEARVIDPETGRDAQPGEPGELWVRGPQVMDGYHGDPEATAATINGEGWLRTGDLVRIHEDGQVVIEDRLKELVKVRGASVPPAEVELVLREHPAVADAAVVGRPDPVRGEVPVAWVIRSEPVDAEELIEFARSRLAPHKRLRAVRFVEELPRMPSGKLQRRLIRDRERAEAAA